MCPLRYLLIIASVIIAVIVMFRSNEEPDYLDEFEEERKEQGKTWYQTLWDYANGRYLYGLYQHYKAKQMKEAGDDDNDNDNDNYNDTENIHKNDKNNNNNELENTKNKISNLTSLNNISNLSNPNECNSNINTSNDKIRVTRVMTEGIDNSEMESKKSK